MDKVLRLNKIEFLLKKKEVILLANSKKNQIKLLQEIERYNLLNDCLQEYLKRQNINVTIQAFSFKQMDLFLEKLRLAVDQQSEIVSNYKKMHDHIMREFELNKEKIKMVNKIILAHKQKQLVEMSRKEDQVLTDLFNQLRNLDIS